MFLFSQSCQTDALIIFHQNFLTGICRSDCGFSLLEIACFSAVFSLLKATFQTGLMSQRIKISDPPFCMQKTRWKAVKNTKTTPKPYRFSDGIHKVVRPLSLTVAPPDAYGGRIKKRHGTPCRKQVYLQENIRYGRKQRKH